MAKLRDTRVLVYISFYLLSGLILWGCFHSSTPNRPPIARAGADQQVEVNTQVTLDGSQSFDIDGNLLIYEWIFDTIPPGSNAKLSDPKHVAPTFDADEAGQYMVRLKVFDGEDNSVVDFVTICAGFCPTQNKPVVVNESPDRPVVVLDASHWYELDADVAYHWDIVAKPPSSLATINTDNEPPFTVSPDLDGWYTLHLNVDDTVEGGISFGYDSELMKIKESQLIIQDEREIDAVNLLSTGLEVDELLVCVDCHN